MNNKILLILSVAFQLSCYAKNNNIRKDNYLMPELKPLSWNMDLKNINEVFSDGNIIRGQLNYAYEGVDNKKNEYCIVRLKNYSVFGKCSIYIEYSNYNNIKTIQIKTIEDRVNCFKEKTNKKRMSCRNIYSKKLYKIFKTLKKKVSNNYGKYKYFDKPKDVLDKRAKEVVWKLKNYNIGLYIMNGEQGDDWDVSLNFVRTDFNK